MIQLGGRGKGIPVSRLLDDEFVARSGIELAQIHTVVTLLEEKQLVRQFDDQIIFSIGNLNPSMHRPELLYNSDTDKNRYFLELFKGQWTLSKDDDMSIKLDNKSLSVPKKMCKDASMFPRLQKIFPFHILKSLFEMEDRGHDRAFQVDSQVNHTFEK
mmetsp:Transcript_23447/g.19676  ORF Transcript_23447/g.19676 Transcript_23447/m.19676 type:complete len:158 (+) Transcript_23447:575-1048(+)